MATAEVYDGEVVTEIHEPIESMGTLAALNSSEIDSQISTAKRYPRSIKQFRNEALQMVTLTEDIAGECIYSLPRAGKAIEGPSARFAEIVLSAWGNSRAGARVISEDERFVTSQGAFFDLQRNVAITYEVKRRITDKSGKKMKDDMVGVASNAACSIALRNAVLKGIPKAFWKDLYEEARRTAIGDAKTLSTKRAAMLDAFGKMGVVPERVFQVIGVEGEADITLDHLAILRGTFTAIKDGETTIEQIFDEKHVPGSKATKSDLNEKLDEPTADPLEAIYQSIQKADATNLKSLYDQHCGPSSPLNESERQRVTRWVEERKEPLANPKGELFEKGNPSA